jgi:hypothetical protein
MASLKIDPRSRYWYACITLPNGRQTQVSTKLRIKEVAREKALLYADSLEKAYRARRAENQFRRQMNEAWITISGAPLPSSSAESFFTTWLGRRKNEVSPSSPSQSRCTISSSQPRRCLRTLLGCWLLATICTLLSFLFSRQPLVNTRTRKCTSPITEASGTK